MLALLWRGARRGARPLAVGAVVAVIWGWGVAQYPYLLPQTLTIKDGAGASETLTAVLIVFGVAVVVVLPALGFLYTLAQRSVLEGEGRLPSRSARPGHDPPRASMIGERTVEGFSALTLATGDGGGLEATFVPDAGMVGCSLRHRGEELLGQRGGAARLRRGALDDGDPAASPVGQPARPRRVLGGGPRRRPRLRPAAAEPGSQRAADPRPARRGERLAGGAARAAGDGALLAASFDFGAHDELMAAFPFPHELLFEATLAGTTLTIATTVRASGDAPVPISFGYHPYLRLPGVDRDPIGRSSSRFDERLRLDRQMLPTGEREAVHRARGRLGSRTFDDAFAAPEGSAPLRPRRRRQADRGLVRRPAIPTRRCTRRPMTTWSRSSR